MAHLDELGFHSDTPGARCPGEQLQVTGWSVQVVGTVVLLIGCTLTLGALPDPVGGALPDGTDLGPLLLGLAVSLALGIGLAIIGAMIGALGKHRSQRTLGASRPVWMVLGRWQRGLGAAVVGMSAVSLVATLITLLLAVNSP
ncbi:hypothetical protein [Nocardioides insulae]|uniref:hypothetical protein n=1 Tax=Nocardioides insulae TaxID=394734 RepID=UPI000404DDCE|nr:hypothetical protein [Nocardioides insulae]